MKFNYTVFSTLNNQYLFDGVSCNLFSINENIFHKHKYLFENLDDGTYLEDKTNLSDYHEIIDVINSKAIIPRSKNEFKYWFDVACYQKDLDFNIQQLMIELTENCNMRCRYCVYSGHYLNERKHGTKKISLSTIQSALNLYLSHSKSVKNKVINFYGGEPLLEFDTIRKVIDDVKIIDSGIQSYITTNGILLSSEVSEWFSNHDNVHFFISLGGIPSIHDNLRVLSDGSSTFNIIRDNMLNLKRIDDASFKERVNFIFNIYDELQLEEINTFLMNDDMFSGIKNIPEITYIDCIEDDGFVRKLGNTIMSKYNNQINPLDLYINLLKNKDHNNIIVKYFDNKYLTIHRRMMNNDQNVLSAVCRPFINKLFIDVNGQISICENFTYGGQFGKLPNNINKEILQKLLDTYKCHRSKLCENCWTSKICSLCFKDLIDNSGAINSERAYYLCNEERKSKKQILTEYCTILEEDETLLDHLDNYEIKQ